MGRNPIWHQWDYGRVKSNFSEIAENIGINAEFSDISGYLL
jgi:hypothetical protein